MSASAPLLALDEVSFAYGQRPVVSHVSLSVAPGQVVGLLGPNGAGKSTLVRLAAGLLRPRAGQVRLAGRDLAGLRRAEIARQIALLPQGAALPEDFTGAQLVLLGRTPHLGWLAAESRRDLEIVARALALVGAEALAERRLADLSGGERQRLLLARALAQEPRLLLLDEPTVHLDLTYQLGLLDLVRGLARSDGLGVLAVFHDLNLAAAYCDEVALLAGGRLLARGEPAATLTPALIQQVYGVRVTVTPHPDTGSPVFVLPAAG
jgi:iron complex transport system ATP-binding protein